MRICCYCVLLLRALFEIVDLAFDLLLIQVELVQLEPTERHHSHDCKVEPLLLRLPDNLHVLERGDGYDPYCHAQLNFVLSRPTLLLTFRHFN